MVIIILMQHILFLYHIIQHKNNVNIQIIQSHFKQQILMEANLIFQAKLFYKQMNHVIFLYYVINHNVMLAQKLKYLQQMLVQNKFQLLYMILLYHHFKFKEHKHFTNKLLVVYLILQML